LHQLALAVLALLVFAWLGNEVLQGDTQLLQVIREGIHHFASPHEPRVMIAIFFLVITF